MGLTVGGTASRRRRGIVMWVLPGTVLTSQPCHSAALA